MQNIKRVMVLAPHIDDGEFGCGGSISKFIEEGVEVFYVAFSTAKASVPPGIPKNILEIEVKDAMKTLGIIRQNLIIYKFKVRELSYRRQEVLEELVKLKQEINPDLVLTPSPHDLHQDHDTVTRECKRAFKHVGILGYELPWNNITFHTQCFIKLKKKHVEKKIQALKCYKSQANKYYATEDFVWSLAKIRGVQIASEFCEAFEVIRWVI